MPATRSLHLFRCCPDHLCCKQTRHYSLQRGPLYHRIPLYPQLLLLSPLIFSISFVLFAILRHTRKLDKATRRQTIALQAPWPRPVRPVLVLAGVVPVPILASSSCPCLPSRCPLAPTAAMAVSMAGPSFVDYQSVYLSANDADNTAEVYSRFPARRPSEGSTTSARSVTTQPNMIDPSQQEEMQQLAAAQILAQQQQQQQQHQQQQQNGQLRQIAPAPRPTSPEYVLANGMSMQQVRDFSVEPAVHNGMGAQFRFQQPHQHIQHQQQPHMGRQPLPSDYMAVNGHHGFGPQMMDRNDSPAPDSGLDIGNPPTRSRSNTNNDQEMRELFGRNSHRSLQDVAKELHGNERGPSSERSRQLFAMLWSVCPPTLSNHSNFDWPFHWLASRWTSVCGMPCFPWLFSYPGHASWPCDHGSLISSLCIMHLNEV